MILVCVLGSGKGSWKHVTKLIADGNWENIFIVGSEWGKETFTPTKEVNWIIVSNKMGFELMKNTIKENLPSANEVAVNFISGEGKVHMATIQALREKYGNFKLAILTKDGLKIY